MKTFTALAAAAACALACAAAPAEFAAFLRKDHERWARVIKTSGVKVE